MIRLINKFICLYSVCIILGYITQRITQLKELKIIVEPENMHLLTIIAINLLKREKKYQALSLFGTNISKKGAKGLRFIVRNAVISIRVLSRVKKTERNAQDVKKIK